MAEIPERWKEVVSLSQRSPNHRNWHDDLRFCAEELGSAEAKVRELEQERQEQLDTLIGVGPIACRNGETHERLAPAHDCMYCMFERIEAKVRELEQALRIARREYGAFGSLSGQILIQMDNALLVTDKAVENG